MKLFIKDILFFVEHQKKLIEERRNLLIDLVNKGYLEEAQKVAEEIKATKKNLKEYLNRSVEMVQSDFDQDDWKTKILQLRNWR